MKILASLLLTVSIALAQAHWPDGATITTPPGVSAILQKTGAAQCAEIEAQSIPCAQNATVIVISYGNQTPYYRVTFTVDSGDANHELVSFTKYVANLDEFTSVTWVTAGIDRLKIVSVAIDPIPIPPIQ